MSAYGVIKVHSSSNVVLPSTAWPCRPNASGGHANSYVTLHHLKLSTAQQLPGLVEYLNNVFTKVVEDGRTYPQEGEMGQEAFRNYFFAADVFVGIINISQGLGALGSGAEVDLTIDASRGERSWEACIAGFYYVKPNYPGRSSHICNAGFVVPDIHRGAGFGALLAQSYLYYAPRLGYQASVFNLVYVNNVASIK
ncbi:hypothetical protein AX17_004603 [Amanita inopinata Kibby_2008]|nr:hypothetical protein AX17_004603 [Amanita inopinata Kibby_2008]